MSKALEMLSRLSATGTPIGKCDLCAESGPLKEVKVNKVTTFACIPCCIDGGLA